MIQSQIQFLKQRCYDFSSPVIQLYMLAADSMSLCRQRDIELTSPVWDACFDRNGQLWVLQKQEGDTLQVYTCQKTDSGVIKVNKKVLQRNWRERQDNFCNKYLSNENSISKQHTSELLFSSVTVNDIYHLRNVEASI